MDREFLLGRLGSEEYISHALLLSASSGMMLFTFRVVNIQSGMESLPVVEVLCRELAYTLFGSEAGGDAGKLKSNGLEGFIRNGMRTYWHQACTAKMGRDTDSVVNGQLRVYGIQSLRIADASVMPHVASSNTMAPCVVIGERAADIIRSQYSIEPSLVGLTLQDFARPCKCASGSSRYLTESTNDWTRLKDGE